MLNIRVIMTIIITSIVPKTKNPMAPYKQHKIRKGNKQTNKKNTESTKYNHGKNLLLIFKYKYFA